eukprot:TRINITY_DN20644_c0_g1_i2.p1 TRINITY_DN20644_c0_g1~~TRINITY_DN20644_c0_g1_i2.p1  ORF type:complete len:397 (+),score=89.17 TRINITY_DN20644_c0_g1_i2:44-1234(+)
MQAGFCFTDEDVSPIIIINNDLTCAGFGGSQKGNPRTTIPSIIWKSPTTSVTLFDEFPAFQKYPGVNFEKHQLLENGKIKDMSLMKLYWKYIIETELRCLPEDTVVLMTIPPFATKSQLEEIVKIFFEEFSVPAFSLYWDSSIAYYSKVYLCVNIYRDYMYVAPVYHGFILKEAMVSVSYGYSKFHDSLSEVLNSKYPDGQWAKEDFSKLFSYYSKEDVVGGSAYTLTANEYNSCAEMFFDQRILEEKGIKSMSLQEMIISSINKAPPELYNTLYQNIIVLGYPPLKMKERIIKEINIVGLFDCKIAFLMGTHPRLGAQSPIRFLPTDVLKRIFTFLPRFTPRSTPSKIFFDRDSYDDLKKRGAWYGADEIYNSSLYITKEYYEEEGPKIIHRFIF